MHDLDAIVVAVAHDRFVSMTSEDYKALFAAKADSEKFSLTSKSILDKADFSGYRYWRL